jgi:TonB family protein
VFVGSDPTVVPPIIVRQDLPPFPGVITVSKQGLIEIVIDENGDVESATIRAPVTPMYDVLALAATKLWRYRPASVDGHAVKFRKFVQVNVSAPPRR